MSILSKAIVRPGSEKVSRANWLYGPFGGAALGVGLASAYTLLFIMYAIVRSSLVVIRVNSDVGMLGTLIAYAASFVIATCTITALMAIPAAIVGTLTAFILKRLLFAFNTQHVPQRTVTIGFATCLAIVVILQLGFQRALGFTLSDVIANPETYLLWLGIPSLIYLAAGSVASLQLNLPQERKIS